MLGLQEAAATDWGVQDKGWFCGTKRTNSCREGAKRPTTQVKEFPPPPASRPSFGASYWQSLTQRQRAEQKALQTPSPKHTRPDLEPRGGGLWPHPIDVEMLGLTFLK